MTQVGNDEKRNDFAFRRTRLTFVMPAKAGIQLNPVFFNRLLGVVWEISSSMR